MRRYIDVLHDRTVQTRAGARRQHHGDDHFGDEQVAERSTICGAAAQGGLCNPDDAGARRVKSKDNVLIDPVSRLARATFKEEERKLGATKFVRLPMSKDTTALMDELAVRLAELEEDGEPTSGTAKNVEEVYARGAAKIVT